MIIYLAYNLKSEKAYIGQTIHQLTNRLSGHLCCAKRGSTSPFHRVLIRDGVEGFIWVILEDLSNDPNASIEKLNSMVVNGLQKHHKGFIWRYESDPV